MPIDLPGIETPADLVAAQAAVLSAIAAETITPQDGVALSTVLERHRRAFELLQPRHAEVPKREIRSPAPRLPLEAPVLPMPKPSDPSPAAALSLTPRFAPTLLGAAHGE